MNDEQVENLLSELSNTRESFDKANEAFDHAIRSIMWNKVNTVIQYCLIFAVFCMGVFGVFYYKSDQRARCESGNDLRIAIESGMEQNALNIGVALAVVFGGSQEHIDIYLDAYNKQPKPPELTLREC